MGTVMQVLVLAVRNSVEYHDLGVATSGATLFRAVGGSLGVGVPPFVPTESGRALLERLIAGRREGLAELLGGWSLEQRADLATMLSKLPRSLVADRAS